MSVLWRAIRNGVGVSAVVVFLVTAVLWLSSYWVRASIQLESVRHHVIRRQLPQRGGVVIRHRRYTAGGMGDRMAIAFRERRFVRLETEREQYESRYPPGLRWSFARGWRTTPVSVEMAARYPPGSAEWMLLGFGLWRDDWPDWNATAPTWSVMLLAGVPAGLWLSRSRKAGRRRRRARLGLCPACGYDLRGSTGGPCPECGTATGGPPGRG